MLITTNLRLYRTERLVPETIEYERSPLHVTSIKQGALALYMVICFSCLLIPSYISNLAATLTVYGAWALKSFGDYLLLKSQGNFLDRSQHLSQ